VRATIPLRFPPDCWFFLQETRASSTPFALPADVRTILDGPPRIELRMPIPEPRFVVNMTRPQAEALQRWLQAQLEGMTQDDRRRLTCLQCISRVAGALSLF
jgi:hypothetical protein